MSCSHVFQTLQQVSCSIERGPFGAYGVGDYITVVPQLVAVLDDERQGVVMVGGQLVAVQDHQLSSSHLLLIRHTRTNTEQKVVFQMTFPPLCFTAVCQ